MKTFAFWLTVFMLLACVAEAADSGDRGLAKNKKRHRKKGKRKGGKKKGKRNKKKGQKNKTDKTPQKEKPDQKGEYGYQVVPNHVLEKLKEKNGLRPDADLPLQKIHSNGSFKLNNKTISIKNEDLTPVNVFAKGATLRVDGRDEVPVSQVYKSKHHPDVILTKQNEGKLFSASLKSGNKFTDVLPVDQDSDTFATVTSDDLDPERMGAFTLDDLHVPDGRVRERRDLQRSANPGTCSEYGGYDVVEVAVVVDSFLCASDGGAAAATTNAQMAVAGASSTYYEVDGLCKKLQITSLDVYCNPATDPIRPMQNIATNICGGSNQLLEQFRSWASNQQGITGHAIHLFHGYENFASNTIGCAYMDSLCHSWDYNVGANEMVGREMSARERLLAHENGHIMSAPHVNNPAEVMNPQLCNGNCNVQFEAGSKAAMNAKVAAKGCTGWEALGPTSAPTSSPTSAPTPTPDVPPPTATPAPPCEDDASFFYYVNGAIADCAWTAASPWKNFLCGYWFISDGCPSTCNSCP